MKLQELIGHNQIDLTIAHIKAFFLGALVAEKPMPFHKAVEEMMAETPEAIAPLEAELKALWDEMAKNLPYELQNIFTQVDENKEFLELAKDQLDFFLTALSLAGTNSETCDNEDLAELIDELEDTVMDLDEYLAGELHEAEGIEHQELLLETWQDFVRTAKR